MAAIKLPRLWSQPTRTGKRIWYVRFGDSVQRVAGPDGRSLAPGELGFLDAYQALVRSAATADQHVKTGTAPGSLAALIHDYRASPEFRNLAAKTQKDYGRYLDRIEPEFGRYAAEVSRAGVFKIRDHFATTNGEETPRNANYAVAVLSATLKWGYNHGQVTCNHALRPDRLQTGPGYPCWTEGQFWQFMDSAASEPLKRAAALGWFTGMRIADCISTPKSARRGGSIEVVLAKTKRRTGARILTEEHPDLTRILDAAPATDATTILTRGDGRPWGLSDLQHKFHDAVLAAGLPDGFSFHGLRKGLTANLAEHGATDAEIEAVVPHSGDMTRHYRKQAQQKRLASAAIARLPERRSGK